MMTSGPTSGPAASSKLLRHPSCAAGKIVYLVAGGHIDSNKFGRILAGDGP